MNAYSVSSQQVRSQRSLTRLPDQFARDGLLAGLIGGLGMTIAGMLTASSAGYDVWLPLKALGSVFFGSGTLGQAGFVAGPVFAGLLAHLVMAAVLGALFTAITRHIWRLPSDFGVPAVSGLVLGLLLWLSIFLTVPSTFAQLAAIAAPFFVMNYIVYGVLTSLTFARLQPESYIASGRSAA